MITHDTRRRAFRALLPLFSAFSLVLGAAIAIPASADTPSDWAPEPAVSPLDYILLLVILPLGLAAVISLLVVLPSLGHDRGYEPGETWRGDSEWFGGPTKGVRAADEAEPAQIEASSKDAGGTSGSW